MIYSFSQLLKEVAGLGFEHGSAESPRSAQGPYASPLWSPVCNEVLCNLHAV